MQLSACSPLSRRQLEHCTPASAGSSGVDVNESKHTLETVKQEKVPTTHEEKEKYFMAQVAMDEWLSAKGPKFNLPAALCFYRALRVYPSPVEPIVIYEWTIPPPIVTQLTNMDVRSPSSPPGKGDTQLPPDNG